MKMPERIGQQFISDQSEAEKAAIERQLQEITIIIKYLKR
jgi:hypothetical protein